MLQSLMYVVIFMMMLLVIINRPGHLPEWRFFGTVLALAALLVINIIWGNPKSSFGTERQPAWDWSFLILSAALVLAIAWMSDLTDAAYLIAILCIQAGFKRGVWPAGALFGVANLAVWYLLLKVMGLPMDTVLLVERSIATGIIFALLLTTLLIRYSQQTKRAESLLLELQAANARLEAMHEKERDLAIAEERVRLARDIHDGLGHHLTVLSIQLQAADKLAQRDPHSALEAIHACREVAQAALEEVRYSVGMLRQPLGENQTLTEALHQLINAFKEHTGIQTCLEQSGPTVDISRQAWQTIYRAVQEGLTNAQKHARNVGQIIVSLAYEADAVCLNIKDDGQGVIETDFSAPHGFGLDGIRERVRQLGGSMNSGPGLAGGFQVELRIPTGELSHDPSASSG